VLTHVYHSRAIVTSMVLTLNSMGSSEILDKYHECCIENGKFHSAFPHEIYPHFQTTLVVFIPNFTATHAITSTNHMLVAWYNMIW